MTTTTLSGNRRSLFPSDVAPVKIISNLIANQQTESTDIPAIDINAELRVQDVSSTENYHTGIKLSNFLHYLAVQNHTGEEFFNKALNMPSSEKFLAEAREELAELDDYAKEEDLDPPSLVAKELAQELLERLTYELPRDYAVSLWEDGDVVIYSANAGWRVSIYCRANGGASFYVNSPDKRDYEGHYESASDMPIGLIIDALEKLSE